jgi:hypothetical protein
MLEAAAARVMTTAGVASGEDMGSSHYQEEEEEG